MTISFTRDSGNFQGLRDRNIPKSYVDFDNEFNKLTDYINNDLKPYVEILEKKDFLGEIGKVNYFLQNISDGTTVFKAFNSNYLSKNNLNFNIFSKLKLNSLISMSDKYFIDNVPLINNVVAIANGNFNWNKVNNNLIEANSISSDKVELSTLNINHITPAILNYGLQNDSIKTNHIIDKELTNSKIAGGITTDRLTPELIALRTNTPTFLPNSILANNIKTNSFHIGNWLNLRALPYISIFSIVCVPKNSVTIIPDGGLNTNLFSEYKIQKQSVTHPQASLVSFIPIKNKLVYDLFI